MKLPDHLGLWGHVEDLGQYSESNGELIIVFFFNNSFKQVSNKIGFEF